MQDGIKQEFAKDFIELQAELATLPKDKKGYGYNYTDFDTIVSYIRPLMKKHNFAFTQCLQALEGKNGIMTMLIHSSGETLSGFCLLPEVKVVSKDGKSKLNEAQELGASITYMKRYGLSAILGISTDEDTDGVTEKPSNAKSCVNCSQPCQNKGKNLQACDSWKS